MQLLTLNLQLREFGSERHQILTVVSEVHLIPFAVPSAVHAAAREGRTAWGADLKCSDPNRQV